MGVRRAITVHDRDQCEAGLEHAGRLLHEEFDSEIGADDVDAVIIRVKAGFAQATVLNFVPLLVRRYAREELLSHLEAKARQTHPSESALVSGSA